MKRTPFLLGAVFCGAMALGCSGSADGTEADTTFPTAAFSTVASTHGALSIEVRTAPTQPPSQGLNAVEYTILTTDGAPSEGLEVTVVPWMPDMGHGASVTPTVTPMGEGRYVVSDVELFMAGKWQLRTTIAGPLEDSVTPTFQIP